MCCSAVSVKDVCNLNVQTMRGLCAAKPASTARYNLNGARLLPDSRTGEGVANLFHWALRDRRKTDREANVLIIIAEGAARYPRDACFLEQAEGIFPRL